MKCWTMCCDEDLVKEGVPRWMGSLALDLSWHMHTSDADKFLSTIISRIKGVEERKGSVWWDREKSSSIFDIMDNQLSILRINRVISAYKSEIGKHSEDIDKFIDDSLDYWIYKRYKHSPAHYMARPPKEAGWESYHTATALEELADRTYKECPHDPPWTKPIYVNKQLIASYSKDAKELVELLLKY